MTPPPAVLAPSVALPELPEPASAMALAAWGPKPDYYTAEQMRDYALAILRASLAQQGEAVAEVVSDGCLPYASLIRGTNVPPHGTKLYAAPAAVAVDAASVRRALALCPTDLPHLERCRWIANHLTAALLPATSDGENNV